jgi:glutamate racemase
MKTMQHHPDSNHPIGIFDSGVGGLSVLRTVRRELPHESVIYIADQGHAPYGSRPKAQIRDFTFGITRFLLAHGAKLIVVACNTASAAALHDLRLGFPDVEFVGMEPAVKPAAETTHTGKVGVLATPTTFAGELYASVVERFANGVQIFQSTCPGLVEQVEAGDLDGPKTRAILEDALDPMLEEGIDTVVMGCTHYPFVIPLIEKITGPGVRTIDPAPAIARQIRRVLTERNLLHPGETPGSLRFYTSGDPAAMQALLPKLLGESGSVDGLIWENDTTVSALSD